MNFFEVRDQPDWLALAQDIRRFQPAIKEIHALRGHLIQPVCAAPVMATSIEKFLPTSMRYLAVSSLLLSFNLISRRGRLARQTPFEKDLTRRANHLHMFSIARIEPAPETGRGLFDSGFLNTRPCRISILCHVLFVMAGLVPAMHAFGALAEKDVDARHEAGHDGSF
jgi:hypothetical protein